MAKEHVIPSITGNFHLTGSDAISKFKKKVCAFDLNIKLIGKEFLRESIVKCTGKYQLWVFSPKL